MSAALQHISCTAWIVLKKIIVYQPTCGEDSFSSNVEADANIHVIISNHPQKYKTQKFYVRTV